jgi:hypothetical protein
LAVVAEAGNAGLFDFQSRKLSAGAEQPFRSLAGEAASWAALRRGRKGRGAVAGARIASTGCRRELLGC